MKFPSLFQCLASSPFSPTSFLLSVRLPFRAPNLALPPLLCRFPMKLRENGGIFSKISHKTFKIQQPGPLPSKKKSQPNSDSAPSESGYSGTGPTSNCLRTRRARPSNLSQWRFRQTKTTPISLIITRSVSWPTSRKRNFRRLVRGSGSLSRRKRTLMTVSPFKPFTK